MFVTPSGHFVLADFDRSHPKLGLGMEVQNCAYENVRIRHSNGTDRYTGPEVPRLSELSEHEGVTPRADMFSLGVVLLEFALQLGEVSSFPDDYRSLY